MAVESKPSGVRTLLPRPFAPYSLPKLPIPTQTGTS